MTNKFKDRIGSNVFFNRIGTNIWNKIISLVGIDPIPIGYPDVRKHAGYFPDIDIDAIKKKIWHKKLIRDDEDLLLILSTMVKSGAI
jgi:hypothetical protein